VKIATATTRSTQSSLRSYPWVSRRLFVPGTRKELTSQRLMSRAPFASGRVGDGPSCLRSCAARQVKRAVQRHLGVRPVLSLATCTSRNAGPAV